MLFVLFIDDISNITVNGVLTKLSADDLKLYTSLLSTDDNHNLQDVLSNRLVWSIRTGNWKSMLVNLTYFIFIKIIHSRITILMAISLSRVTWIMILVLTSTYSTTSEHIDRIVAKGIFSHIGLLFRGFVSPKLHVFRQAYITYIRPLLEYASNVWSPHLLMHINSIERVQRHFTKRLTELRDFSYRERLSILNLDTLEYLRVSCDLTMYYKIFNNPTPWSPSEYFNVRMPPYSLHYVYHDFNIRKSMCRTNSFENDFFNWCVSTWNSLPSSLVKSKYVASFKYNLKSIDLSSFLNYVF